MVNTPPSARPPPPPAVSSPTTAPSQRYSNPGRSIECGRNVLADRLAFGHDRDSFGYRQSASSVVTSLEDQYPAAATAAVALAQLHNHRPDSDWDSEAVRTTLVHATPAKICVRTMHRKPKSGGACTPLSNYHRFKHPFHHNIIIMVFQTLERESSYLQSWVTHLLNGPLHYLRSRDVNLFREGKGGIDRESPRSPRTAEDRSTKRADRKTTEQD